MSRIFLIVLDSLGIGGAADAEAYGDAGADTLRSVYAHEQCVIPNLRKLGLLNIEGIDYADGVQKPQARFARLKEASAGKDTTIGHWEIAGIISQKPLPTYPEGFPAEIIAAFAEKTGRGVLCNLPYSGTDVIRDYGDEHLATGKLIVYTSADSVFQIAAHEEEVPCEELYRYCEIARVILSGEHGVGRVIARPFLGSSGNYQRTARRHDFSLAPPKPSMLDYLKEAGYATIGVGKINDIFAGSGLSEYVYSHGNAEGIEQTINYIKSGFNGLCFVNLVDFDMLYGHRNDVAGYANALGYFDGKLAEMLDLLRDDDLLMITADHGCDPGFTISTDHSRENVPLVIYGKAIGAGNLGCRESFADIAATVLRFFGVEGEIDGTAMDFK